MSLALSPQQVQLPHVTSIHSLKPELCGAQLCQDRGCRQDSSLPGLTAAACTTGTNKRRGLVLEPS